MKLSEISGAPAPDDTKRTTLSAIPAAPSQQQDDTPSTAGSFFRGLLHGMESTAMGVGQLASRLPISGTMPLPRALPSTQGAVDQAIRGQEQAFQASPGVGAHPTASMLGNITGQAAATAPLAMIPGGAVPSALGRIAGGVAGGALGAATQPVMQRQGAPPGDYWKEKAQQMAVGGAVGGALPAVGGALAPRLPSPANPFLQAQGAARAFRPLANFVMGAEERTVDGFNRTIARQVLDPIGAEVPKNLSGGGLVKHVRDQIGAVYDRVLPQVTLPRSALGPVSPEFRRFVDTMSTDHQIRFRNLLRNYVADRFDLKGKMNGKLFQRMRSELGSRARAWTDTNDDELATATHMAIDYLDNAVARSNPSLAPELERANTAYRLYIRMSDAASKPTGEGAFSATDLLRALRRGTSPQAFAIGDDALQRYAQVGRAALGEGRSSPLQLLHIFTRHGAVAEAGRSMAGPVGRGMKTTGSWVAPSAGAVATDERNRNQAGDQRSGLVTAPPP